MGYNLSSTSWIGSVYVFLLFALSAVSGRLFDAGYFRHLLICGSLLQVVGMFMASISTQYWQIFLSQGICGGLGAGLTYCPVMACVSTYFSKKRALAIAIVTRGSESSSSPQDDAPHGSSKRPKFEHSTVPPPAFWDGLSELPLCASTLRELDRRNTRRASFSCHSIRNWP
jgi:hypothetical protein